MPDLVFRCDRGQDDEIEFLRAIAQSAGQIAAVNPLHAQDHRSLDAFVQTLKNLCIEPVIVLLADPLVGGAERRQRVVDNNEVRAVAVYLLSDRRGSNPAPVTRLDGRSSELGSEIW